MYNKCVVSTYDNINDLKSTLIDIGFTNEVDGDDTHYYWYSDTSKKFYMSLENLGSGYVEFIGNVIDGEDIHRFRMQPFALNTSGHYGNSQMDQQSLSIYTISLYNGGIVFGIRNTEEYQTGFDGNTITWADENIVAQWFTIIAPETRGVDEWYYLINAQCAQYDETQDTYVSLYPKDRLYGATSGEITTMIYGDSFGDTNALNCNILRNIRTSVIENGTVVGRIMRRNLWTLGNPRYFKNGTHIFKLYTASYKKYILLNNCYNFSLLCRYS